VHQARAATGPERDLAGVPPVDKQRIVPKLFLKPSSAIIGPGDTLCLPGVSHANDWEVELAVVIGTRCRNIGPARALDMVFGYTIANDVSARTTEWSVERDPDKWNEFFDWLNGSGRTASRHSGRTR